MALALAAWALGCGASAEVPEPGAVLLRVKVKPGAPVPDELRVSVYDDSGALWRDVPVPRARIAFAQELGQLGTILIQPGTTLGALRVHLRGWMAGTACAGWPAANRQDRQAPWLVRRHARRRRAGGRRRRRRARRDRRLRGDRQRRSGRLPGRRRRRRSPTRCRARRGRRRRRHGGRRSGRHEGRCGGRHEGRCGDRQRRGAGSGSDAGSSSDAGSGTDAGSDAGPTCGFAGGLGLPRGATCASDEQCASSFCVDRVCCADACAGKCRAAISPATTACAWIRRHDRSGAGMRERHDLQRRGSVWRAASTPGNKKARGEICAAANVRGIGLLQGRRLLQQRLQQGVRELFDRHVHPGHAESGRSRVRLPESVQSVGEVRRHLTL